MPLGNDVVTQAQSQARSQAGGFGGEEGLKYLIQHLFRNTGTVIPDCYQNDAIIFLGTNRYGRFITGLLQFLPFRYGIKRVVDEVEDDPAQVLG